MEKRGQITIFVILAIVILIIAGGIYYFVTKQKDVLIGPGRDDVSDDLKPLQKFIEDCTNSLAREAIIKLGEHGGYIDPTDSYISGRLFIAEPAHQTESDLAYLSADRESAVAYWYYSYSMPDCNNCLMMSQAPYIDEMERQISIYVSENYDSCLNSFESFKGMQIEYSSEMFVKTTLRDQDVIVESIYPINVSSGGTKAAMENYYTVVDIPLMKYYMTALDITRAEYDYGYLENLDLYLLHAYSGLDGKYLPPMYAYTNDYDILFWSKTQTRKRFNDLVTSYIPMIRVPNTKNYKEIDTRAFPLYEQNFYEYLKLPLFNESLPNTEISFIYMGEGMAMDINPSKEELLGPYEDANPASEISMLPPRQVNTYQFFYDISHPVFVEINDEYKPGENYRFVFALETNIKENLKLKDWWNASNRPLYFDPQFFRRTLNDPLAGRKLNDSNNRQYEYRQRPTENLFCNDNQRLSGIVTLKTYDASNGKALPDVSVSFGCGNFASCAFGRTVYNETTQNALFSDTLPLCLNGYLRLKKNGYHDKKIPLSTELGNSKSLGSFDLEPIITKNLTIKRFEVGREIRIINLREITTNYVLSNMSQKLNPNDTVSLTFTKLSVGTLDAPYAQTIMFTGKDNSTNIRLIPGRYALSGQLIDDKGFIIYKECKEICVDTEPLNPFGGEKCEKVPKDSIQVKPAIWGGIEFTNSTSITITREDLLKNKTLEVYIFRMPDPRCIDDMKEGNMVESLSRKFRQKLLPKFR